MKKNLYIKYHKKKPLCLIKQYEKNELRYLKKLFQAQNYMELSLCSFFSIFH